MVNGALLIPIYGEPTSLAIAEEPRLCRGCGEAKAFFVVRQEGDETVARCLLCDGRRAG